MYDAKKNYIKNIIYRTISDLQNEISFCKETMKGEIFFSQITCSEKELKERIKNRIRGTQLLDHGYIWVNKVLNYDGGDDYAIRLVHPNLIKTEGMRLSTSMQDIKGNTPYLTELEGVKDKGEIFFQYWFKKKDSDKISQKLTFAKLYKPYDWIIATGVYLDDIEDHIVVYENEIESDFYQSLFKICLTGLAGMVAAFLIANFFNRKIIRTISRYEKDKTKKENFIKEININLEKRVKDRTKQIRESKRKLDSSNKRYQSLFQYAPVPLWEEDFSELYQAFSELREKGIKDFRKHIETNPLFLEECSEKVKILDVNLEALKLHGATSKDELLGNLDQIFTRKSFKTFQEEVIALSEGHLEFESEGEVKSLSGQKKSIFLKMIVFREQGESYRAFIATVDMTDRNQMEERLKLSQKMESIGTLAGGIAHDFNNILSSIIGFTELALDDVEKGTAIEDDLQEILSAGMRAKDLVKQILTFARQSDESLKPVQINAIVKEVLKFLKSSIPANIDISDKLNTDSFVMASPTHIHQIFMNLCTNAAHAMEEKGGFLEISATDVEIDMTGTIPELKSGEYIKIQVTDTGIGIPPDNIESIFEPYFTTKKMGEGTGMGLAVVHGIVESYGGKIMVNNRLTKGTCFSVYLPITKKRKTHSSSKETNLPMGSERILFVDDEDAIAKMGSRFLKRLGYSVATRTSSIEALELFRSKPQEFDLVITDMTMPKMTGDKLATELMKIRPGLPVVLCTGYSKTISEESAVEIGIKSFAYKPLVQTDLAMTVRKILDETSNY